MKLSKRTLIIAAAVEVVIITFCLVISIIVMTTMDYMGGQYNISKNGEFIGTLQNNPTLFALAICLPLFIVFVVDGVYLIMYATQRESTLNEQEKAELLEEAKKQAREEALAELRAQKKEEPKEEPKEEEPKAE